MKRRFACSVISIFLTICLMLVVACKTSSKINYKPNTELWTSNYPYVFVHGLSGWGDYNSLNAFYSYWGLSSGSIPEQLRAEGFNCVCASMSKSGSAWDRTCELYAQLTGSVVDYGLEHSTRCNHPRYGTDYSKNPLVEKWNEENKINLVGHSFGGVVVRMLIQFMEEGCAEERAVTAAENLSPLFAGGHKNYVNSVVTLATPHNGVSAMEIYDKGFEETSIYIRFLERAVSPINDGRAAYDCIGYDMHIDEAARLNKKLCISKDIYYFSVPANSSVRLANGEYEPDKKTSEIMFKDTSVLIGTYIGKTTDGYFVDENWRENDGIVNVISARAPFTEPSVDFDEVNIYRGIWNVMPVFMGDHLAFIGGLSKKVDTKTIYVPLFDMINQLE